MKTSHKVSFELTPQQLKQVQPLARKIKQNADSGQRSATIGQLLFRTDGSAYAQFAYVEQEEFLAITEVLSDEARTE